MTETQPENSGAQDERDKARADLLSDQPMGALDRARLRDRAGLPAVGHAPTPEQPSAQPSEQPSTRAPERPEL